MATMALRVAESFGMSMGPWGWAAYLGAMIVDNMIMSALTPTQTTTVGKASELSMQTAAVGAVIKKGYGTTRITGNIIWGTKFTEHVHTESSGGKGGGGGSEVKSYTYSVSFAVMICEGPINKIVSVLADGTDFNLSDCDYRLYTGTEDQLPDDFMESIEGSGKVPAYRGMAYIVFRNLALSNYGNRIPTFTFTVEFPKNTLTDIIQDISNEAGLIKDMDYSVDGIADMTVDGFTRDGGTTYREQIQQLQSVKTFDAAERYGVITFKTRDFSRVIPIPASAIGAYENEKPSEPIESTRSDDINLPAKISLTYISKDSDYTQAQQTAFRRVTGATDEATITTNVVMTDAAAKIAVEQKLMEAWEARTNHKMTLALKYGYIMPLDILLVTMPNGTGERLVYVTKTQFGKPGLNNVEAVDINSDVYNLVERNVDTPPEVIETVSSPVITNFLDIPKLPVDTNSSDDYVYIATGNVTNFGANIYRSLDGGASYNYVAGNDNNAACGSAVTKLPDALPYSWDHGSVLIVYMDVGELSSHTKAEILNYYNAALVGNEIIQFLNAELIDTNTYKLTGLLRGRNGTEQYTGTHTAGERFVLLGTNNINTLAISSNYWYTQCLFRVGPRNKGYLTEDYHNEQFTPQGTIQKPWSPCHIKGTRDSDGNLVITWIRRTRKNGAWKDHSDAPLSENTEAYDIEVLSTDGNIKRNARVNVCQYVYSSAAQIDDFGSIQNNVIVKIYQISDVKGRGWPGLEAV